MRRDTLLKAVARVMGDLRRWSITETLESVIEDIRTSERDESTNHNIIAVFHAFTIATHDYTDVERNVCRIFEIDELFEPIFWESLLGPISPTQLFGMRHSVSFLLEQAPKMLDLIGQDYVADIKQGDKDLPEQLKGKSLLSVIIVEDEGQFSAPSRLTYALNAISELYEVFAELENENANDLIVLACDSGSDKSFDFLGVSKITESIKELILEIWDRRVFYRQKHVSETLSVITESLTVLERIAELKENESLDREQAELLKRKVISGATHFIEAGAIIPEIEAESGHSPKQLLKPEPKLLVSPWATSETKDSESVSDTELVPSDEGSREGVDDLSDDEVELLDSLLTKAKKRKKKKKPRKN